jgi:trimethylamine--corrinoid protein Co-methyltransferase
MQVLSKEEISKIHYASLEILQDVGLRIRSDKALGILDEAGARVDFKEKRAWIPNQLVDEALKSAPRIVTLYDRGKKPYARVGEGRMHAVAGMEGTYVLVSESGERRLATRKDVADFSRLADALENVHIVSTLVLPRDAPPKYSELYAAQIILNNTEKHSVFAPQNMTITHALLDMARAVVGENLQKSPILSFIVSPTSPLTWGADDIETVMEAAENGILCSPSAEPMPGASAPITLAGTLALQNAESLSGILISQLARKGAPILYGAATPMFDMREGSCYLAGPEATLLRIAHTQLGKFYGLPVSSSGLDSDSHCLDEQNAWEKILTALVTVSSDADIIWSAGIFAVGMTASLEQLVIDNEILGLLFRLRRGIDVTPETLALDTLRRIKPGQDFLRERDFTLKYLKKEYWMPELSNRIAFSRWVEKGSKSITQVAREKAQEILRQHVVKELDKETQTKLSQIVRQVEKSN